MKKFVPILFINIFLVLIQASFFRELFGSTYNPNLVIALAFAFFFAEREDLSFMSAFVGGLFLDLFGFFIVGISPLVIIAGIIGFKFIKQYLFKGWLTNILLVIFTQIMYVSVVSGFSQIGREVFYSASTTMILSVLFYFVVEKILVYFKKSGYEY